MASFGVEAIRYFSNARAAKVSTAGDLTYTFNRANGFDQKLRGGGASRAFYWANTDCWETDIRDTDQGGDDRSCVDNVISSGLKPTAITKRMAARVCSTTRRKRSGAPGPINGNSAKLGTPNG